MNIEKLENRTGLEVYILDINFLQLIKVDILDAQIEWMNFMVYIIKHKKEE